MTSARRADPDHRRHFDLADIISVSTLTHAGLGVRICVQTPSTPSPTAKSGAVNPGMTDPASCQRSRESHPEPLIDTHLEIHNEWRPHDARDDQTPNEDLESLPTHEESASHGV